MEFETVLNSLRADLASLNILAEYLGYTVGKSPINPESDWRIFFSDKEFFSRTRLKIRNRE